MPGFSDRSENAILNSIFGKTSDFGVLASAPTIYLALCTAAPNDASTGSTLTEANYTSYARKQTSASDWGTASGGSISNSGELAFPQATGGSSTVTHVALVDASSGGNVIAWGALSSSLAVSSGITPRFQAGQLSLSLD